MKEFWNELSWVSRYAALVTVGFLFGLFVGMT